MPGNLTLDMAPRRRARVPRVRERRRATFPLLNSPFPLYLRRWRGRRGGRTPCGSAWPRGAPSRALESYKVKLRRLLHMRRAAATACPICSRRRRWHPPRCRRPRPGRAPLGGPRPLAPPAHVQGSRRKSPGRIPLSTPACPHTPGTWGDPGHAQVVATRGGAGRAFANLRVVPDLHFISSTAPRPPRGAGGSRLGSAPPLRRSKASLCRCRRLHSPAAVRALNEGPRCSPKRKLHGIARPRLPGSPIWPSSLSAACVPGLGTRLPSPTRL